MLDNDKRKLNVGIITIYDRDNYGNTLQNYALQRNLEELGFNAETIDRYSRYSTNTLVGVLRYCIRFLYHMTIKRRNDFPEVKRRISFNRFRKNGIKYSQFKVGNNIFPTKYESMYDYYVFGSDQIWNLFFDIIVSNRDIYFGTFTRKEKKIAYSASFGTTTIPLNWSEYVKEKLIDFKEISVREDTGVELVKELTHRLPVITPDPTLLLSCDEWRKVSSRPSMLCNSRYVLTYFLGDKPDYFDDIIKKYVGDKQASIVNLNDSLSKCENKNDIDFYSAAPDEFLWLIDNALFFFTDSFHGCVFSLIFSTPFIVYPRVALESGNDMDTRIISLLSKYGEDKRYDRNMKKRPEELENMDQSVVERVRISDMEVGVKFLGDSLK